MEKSIKAPYSYNEAYGILLALGNNFINRIPKEVLDNITGNLMYKIVDGKKIYDVPQYNLKVSLNIQGVSKEALSIIYYLYYNYWCDSDKEKKYLQSLIKNNEKKIEKIKKEKYEKIDIFSNNDMQEKHEENMLITKSENKGIKKFFAKLLNIFKR